MAQRINADMGLVDGMTADLGGPRTAKLLDRLDAAVAWKDLVAPIAKLAEYRAKRGGENKGGRPAWQPETMLRCMRLAKWFNLGDAQLEECLKDRLSFRRFIGLSLTDATPDETTFVVFRRRLRESGLDRTIFEATLAQLEKGGLLVKEGTLVDATIIEQARRSTRDNGTSTRDLGASFTKKSRQTHFGYIGSVRMAETDGVQPSAVPRAATERVRLRNASRGLQLETEPESRVGMSESEWHRAAGPARSAPRRLRRDPS
ncbi:MAG: transposase [Phycisphaeraceae bacterium]|nr:transposase [Phycisphaeraceae bacterium]